MAQSFSWSSLEDEPGPMLDAFDTDALRSRATAGGRAYSCLRDSAGGHQWHAETHEGAVRGCRVDALLASEAAVYGSALATDDDDACRRPEPCLRDEKGILHCLSSESTDMPTIVDGEWQCDSAQPTPATHEKLGPDHHTGGLSGILLRPLTPPPEPCDEMDSAAAPNSPAPNSPAPIEPDPPALAAEDTSDIAVPESAAPATGAATWLRCDWFQGRSRHACAVDSDCPISDSDAFEAWFDAVNERTAAGTTSVPAFLQAAAEDATKVELCYDDTAAAVKDRSKLRKATLRARLEGLYRTDPTFHSSVSESVRSEPRVAQEAAKKRSSSCMDGACRAGPAPSPSTSLFDGTTPIAFQRRSGGGLAYTRGGEDATRDVPAEACEGISAPSECRDPAVPVVAGVRGSRPPMLIPGQATVAPGYRVEFADGANFYVRNAVQVYGTLDSQAARESCGAALCQHNAGACPAPHCRIDGAGECVPDPERVHEVRFR